MGLAVIISVENPVQGNGFERLPYAFTRDDFTFLFTCPHCGWQGRRTILASDAILSEAGRLTISGLVPCGNSRTHLWAIINGAMTSASIRDDKPDEVIR